MRETLFNVLTPRIQGSRFLDLYAGSGAVGVEAISRGAECVIFVEQAHSALKILRRNLTQLNVAVGFCIEPMSVVAYLKRRRADLERGYDVVFLDPPYDAIDEYEAALGLLGRTTTLLAENALVIAEHRRKQLLNERYGSLKRTRSLLQGDAALSFYEAIAPVPAG